MLVKTDPRRNDARFSLRVPSDLAEELERCAQRNGTSPSAEVRRAMLAHVARDFDTRLGYVRSNDIHTGEGAT